MNGLNECLPTSPGATWKLSCAPGAVTALIDLDRAAVRVLDDGAASPVPHLELPALRHCGARPDAGLASKSAKWTPLMSVA